MSRAQAPPSLSSGTTVIPPSRSPDLFSSRSCVERKRYPTCTSASTPSSVTTAISQSSNATGTSMVAVHDLGIASVSRRLQGLNKGRSPSASSAEIRSGLSKPFAEDPDVGAAVGVPLTWTAHAPVTTANNDSPNARLHRDIAQPPVSAFLVPIVAQDPNGCYRFTTAPAPHP